MRIKDTRITYFIYLPYECAAVEEYLEKMAEMGWLLQSVKGPVFKFKKIEPEKIKYSVDVLNKISIFDHKDSDDALEYREYCEAAGWTYVCQTGKIQIFYTKDDKETISIHTDETEKFKSVFKASLTNVLSQMLLIIVFAINIYMQLIMGSSDFELASNLAIFGLVSMTLVIFINSIQVISFFVWTIKARRKLKENKFMPYNNYKQLRIKNIIIKSYTLIISLLLLKVSVFNNYQDNKLGIFTVLIAFIPLIIMLAVQGLINKKRYSKNTNMVITIGGTIASVYIVLSLMGVILIGSITGDKENKVSTDKVSLALEDFGYKEDEKTPYFRFDKSIIAERTEYYSNSGDNNLDYSILRSKYSWAIKFHEKRLVNTLNKYGKDLKLENTKLPSNIKVYADNKKECFVLTSEDKVIKIRNNFSGISEDEFLNKVYKKIFN